MSGTIGGAIESATSEGPGFLERFKLVKDTKIITNPDGSQSVVPVTDFFEKYSPLLKLGTVGATPTIVNAVLNALRDFDVDDLQMPLTPEKICRIINNF